MVMATVLKIKWVENPGTPDTRHPARYVGGSSRQFQWKHSQKEVMDYIERGVFDYYVEKNSRPAKLKVGIAPDGQKYLKIETNVEYSLDLLNLPPFPKVELHSPERNRGTMP